MFPLTIFSRIPLSTYFYIALGLIIAGLGFYCKALNGKNDDLLQKNASLTTSYNQKVSVLTQCSNGVDALEKKEKTMDADKVAAVEKAKKEAVADYISANSYLFRKPKVPVITPDNVKNYGGPDKDVQLKDYLATQDLMNEFIDRKTK